jgi:hypothetical protein
VIGVDVEAGDAVLDDLQRATVAGGEGRQARDHRLDDRQAERLEEGRLDEAAARIRHRAVELPDHVLLRLHLDPARLAAEIEAVEQLVHPLDLVALVGVVRPVPGRGIPR